jgi:hypothetical protein
MWEKLRVVLTIEVFGDKIILTVPAGPAAGKGFDYAILSKSDGCVDPRATYN